LMTLEVFSNLNDSMILRVCNHEISGVLDLVIEKSASEGPCLLLCVIDVCLVKITSPFFLHMLTGDSEPAFWC